MRVRVLFISIIAAVVMMSGCTMRSPIVFETPSFLERVDPIRPGAVTILTQTTTRERLVQKVLIYGGHRSERELFRPAGDVWSVEGNPLHTIMFRGIAPRGDTEVRVLALSPGGQYTALVLTEDLAGRLLDVRTLTFRAPDTLRPQRLHIYGYGDIQVNGWPVRLPHITRPQYPPLGITVRTSVGW